jgi:hypothetical protein
MKMPDFYLSSGESIGDWLQVRACWIEQYLRGWNAETYALVRLDPAAATSACSLGSKIDRVVLAPHYEGMRLFPITSYPLPVYVYELCHPLSGDVVQREDVIMAAWCEVYQTEEAARANVQAMIA